MDREWSALCATFSRDKQYLPGVPQLLLFLWWPGGGGHLEANLKEYCVVVHIFGAVSSPSIANLALKKTTDFRVTVTSRAGYTDRPCYAGRKTDNTQRHHLSMTVLSPFLLRSKKTLLIKNILILRCHMLTSSL